MSEIRYTEAQREAIYTRGRPVLVSAGAGSGKTKVLTQRLVERVLAGGDIDRFLVITFTRAAAAELRSRVMKELTRLAAEDPGNRHLRRQSALLYRSQIGTIDSFCTTVVRENARLLALSPTFSVMDEEKSAQMLERSLEEVLEGAYEDLDSDPAMRALIDSVGAGRDDASLRDAVLRVYRQLQSRPWPREWAEKALDALDVSGLADAGQTIWGRYILEETASGAAYCAGRLETAVRLMTRPGDDAFMDGWRDSFSQAASLYRELARACADGWDRARGVLMQAYPRLSAKRKNTDEELKARLKPVWDACREEIRSRAETFAVGSAALLDDIALARPQLEALMTLVFRLEDEYAERKRRADALDFSDAEHFCVRLLADAENGVAEKLSNRFAEVMVDEYQDVNEVQEFIFRKVSGEGERLFMVGDVKQSIYRFRLAEPEIFNRKYRAFSGDGHALRVDLRENFRSRGAVLDACNAVFGRIMSPELGDVAYDDSAALVRGEGYYPDREHEPLPELCVVDRAGLDRAERVMAEPRYVARRIRELVEAGAPVYDGNGGMRPMEYGDIAILLRTANRTGGAYRRALAEEGVPVSALQGGGFFARPEIRFCAAMLAVADNPRQDVPLVAALRGLPFAFTPDELSALRAADRRGGLWDGLCRRAEQGDEKCARFASLVAELRDRAREEPTESLLRWLYDRTGLYAACAAMPDGDRRGAALMQLYEYARRFEAEGSRGLFRFVAWLRRLEELGAEPQTESGVGAVRIMTIHKSKGLEFPVVFVSDCNHRWTDKGHSHVRFHSELGLGLRLTDTEAGVSRPTLPLTAIEMREKREELSEWERLLYVAMTRAGERLFITCAWDDAPGELESLRGGEISPRILERDANIAKWVVRAAQADAGRTICLHVETPPADAAESSEAEASEPPAARPEDVRALAERLAWRYPFAGADIPSKLTATGIRSAADIRDPEAATLGAARKTERRLRKPVLGKEDAPLTGAERGVAEHLVMQYIDFSRVGSIPEIAAEIERLRERGFLDARQAASVPPEDILAFAESGPGRRLLAADAVLREFRFSLLCPAARWFSEAEPEEEILLQGVVDCCIEEDGALTVIDFKTDAKVEPSLYTEQLEAYAEAMERVTGKPVRQAILWYLRLRRAVTVPLDGKN